MFFESPKIIPDLEEQLLVTQDQGEKYADALLQLFPELQELSETDEAAAFDVGAGADLVALEKLGFQQVVWTNDPDPQFPILLPQKYQRDEVVLAELLKTFPTGYYGSSMSAGEWLRDEAFNPRLTTMLHMAPQYFSSELQAVQFLRLFGEMAKRLNRANLIVVSAMGDHRNSERAFIVTNDFFRGQDLNSQLFLKPQNLFRAFGEQVLVIRGKQ